jgi:hypothetical protein
VKQISRIGYDTAELQNQWCNIVASKLNAVEKLSRNSYVHATGLDEDDPPELWRYSTGRGEPPRELSKRQAVRENTLADQIRRYKPDFAGDPQTYRRFRERLSTPTLAKTVLALEKRFQDDAALERRLTKLLMLRKGYQLQRRGDTVGFNRTALPELTKRFPNNDDELAKHLAKLLGLRNKGLRQKLFSEANAARLLVMNWIDDPPGKNFVTRSFCFFSDRAMATLIHYLLFKEWLMPENGDTEQKRAQKLRKLDAQTTRIKKLYQRLRLRPAKPRAIRELKVRFGKVHFIYFGARRLRGKEIPATP